MKHLNDAFYLIPAPLLKQLLDGQEAILSKLNSVTSDVLSKPVGDYISEAEAKKLLNKKTTWFWNMRKSELLPFSKIGNTVYYKKQDILELLNK